MLENMSAVERMLVAYMQLGHACSDCILSTCSSSLSCVQVRPFNLKDHKVIRDLEPADANTLISVSGMITRSSSTIPDSRSDRGRLHVEPCLTPCVNRPAREV